MCMLAQVGIPVPSTMVLNIGGATGVSSGRAWDDNFALDMQVQSTTFLPGGLLCVLQSVKLGRDVLCQVAWKP